jgi:hypothetical protein
VLPNETLDSRRKGEIISINSKLAAMGQIQRSANNRRETSIYLLHYEKHYIGLYGTII